MRHQWFSTHGSVASIQPRSKRASRASDGPSSEDVTDGEAGKWNLYDNARVGVIRFNIGTFLLIRSDYAGYGPRTTHIPRHSSSSDVYRCGCNPDDRSSIFGTGDNM